MPLLEHAADLSRLEAVRALGAKVPAAIVARTRGEADAQAARLGLLQDR